MSLAGFDHVFHDAVQQDIGEGLMYGVVPPPVLALLKIASYLDNPQLRAKDLLDFRSLMQRYERDSERIFSDAVFDADLSDARIRRCVSTWIGSSGDCDRQGPLAGELIARSHQRNRVLALASADNDWGTRDTSRLQLQLSAFLERAKRDR